MNVCFTVHQVPTASVTIEGASALNRVRWSSGGKEVAVGDSEGRVWVYDTGEVPIMCFHFFNTFPVKRTQSPSWYYRVGALRCNEQCNHYQIMTVTFETLLYSSISHIKLIFCQPAPDQKKINLSTLLLDFPRVRAGSRASRTVKI